MKGKQSWEVIGQTVCLLMVNSNRPLSCLTERHCGASLQQLSGGKPNKNVSRKVFGATGILL